MTAQEHIMTQLQALAQPVPFEDIGSTPLEDAIFAKVMSKKFRKLKADEATIQTAKRAIAYAVKRQEPVTVSFLFGGNKLWRFEEAPEVDWAELFSLIYFVRWMKSIASVYPHGARLDYYSEDVAVETLNNITKEETEAYSQSFRGMLEWAKPYIPNGDTVTYRRYGDEYARYEDYLQELEAAKAELLKQNGGKLPILSEALKAATELNVRLFPGQDDDPDWREKVELNHKALEATETIEHQYFKDESLVMACPTWYSGWIATGSTKRSYAKFWAGVGVLEQSAKGYSELVLTPKQLQAATNEWESVDLPGLTGKNFSKIRIVQE
jgi:hypothetical protein